MSEKRFRKIMGFIKDNACEGGDVEGVMDLTEIEDMLNELYEENGRLRTRLNNIKIYVEFQLQEAENDLKTSIKGGMPTGSLYEKINLLKDTQTVIYNVRD